MRATAASLKIGAGFSVLGIAWDPDRDCFYFNISLESLDGPVTKRSVLVRIAKLYDPLGWIAPSIVALKIFMQSLWMLTREWDSTLPDDYVTQWIKLYSSLKPIANIRINRWIGVNSANQRYELHGFADASKLAYAAVVYLRVLGENSQVFLLGAKTKVAPTKTLSIPRLELCAAQLVTKLTKHFVDTLQLTATVHLWSDSRDVLYWLREVPSKWPTFIANRCSDIITTIPDAYWHHINSADNPADMASRGCSAGELQCNSLWWNGPRRLSENTLDWSRVHDVEPRNCKAYKSLRSEIQSVSIALSQTGQKQVENWDLLDKFSSLHKLTRVTAYLLRFISSTVKNSSFKNKISPFLQYPFNPSSTDLQGVEVRNAELVWCKLTQSVCYASQVGILQRGEELGRYDQLKSLNPMLRDGLLRVGGRLKNALLSEDEKFPIILPANHRFTDLVITQAHQLTLHGGTSLTLTHIRRKYWITKAKLKVKTLIHNCVKCKRFQASQECQIMGNLPAKRVQPARPFANSGVDYAGPFSLRTSRHRGFKSFKGYFAVFVCFSTKAVHLEPVSSYDTESFLAAFKRFVARRGPCINLRSDQGTNFVGADAELRKMYKKGSDHSRAIRSAVSKLGTTWSFNPPGASHFGGIWEAAVKSVKRHLKRVVGDTILTFEEFSTILCQVEACLNSRPIIPLTDDAAELFVLTPAYFLIGESSLLITEPDISNEKVGPLQRWRRTTQLVQRFWHHWSHEYLHQLQRRSKWKDQQPLIKVGDVVLIRHETTSPTRWPLGRVEEVFPGKDNLIRVVSVKTATTTLRRPIVKLVKLLDSSPTEE